MRTKIKADGAAVGPLDYSLEDLAHGLRYIVDPFHVGTSNRKIIAEFWRRPKFRRHPRAERHHVYRAALLKHRQNRELYAHVMGGTNGRAWK